MGFGEELGGRIARFGDDRVGRGSASPSDTAGDHPAGYGEHRHDQQDDKRAKPFVAPEHSTDAGLGSVTAVWSVTGAGACRLRLSGGLRSRGRGARQLCLGVLERHQGGVKSSGGLLRCLCLRDRIKCLPRLVKAAAEGSGDLCGCSSLWRGGRILAPIGWWLRHTSPARALPSRSVPNRHRILWDCNDPGYRGTRGPVLADADCRDHGRDVVLTGMHGRPGCRPA